MEERGHQQGPKDWYAHGRFTKIALENRGLGLTIAYRTM
jgi:hypothetical protein